MTDGRPTCSTCVHWWHDPGLPAECRKEAPTALCGWPVTKPENGCSEHPQATAPPLPAESAPTPGRTVLEVAAEVLAETERPRSSGAAETERPIGFER